MGTIGGTGNAASNPKRVAFYLLDKYPVAILAAMSRVKTDRRTTARALVTAAEQLPDFSSMTREQEADWWDEHDVADELWEEGPEVDAEVTAMLGVPEPKRQ